jgi:protein-disulfide isomerase
MSKRFLLLLVAIFAIFVGFVAFGKHNKTNIGGDSGDGSQHFMGAGKTQLVEFGDYQCPGCGSYYPYLKALAQKHPKDLIFRFRNFPLVNIHKNAMAAARAAEASDKQGKFWEMHDMLYERQKSWETSPNAAQIFEDYATELGLNIDQFKRDVSSSAVSDIINSDIKAAQNLRATGTPTMVLDGKMIELPNNPNQFTQMVEDAIKQK